MKNILLKMSLIYRFSLIFIIFFSSFCTLHSKNISRISQLNFRILNTKEGLPTSEVQKVYQDDEGFMWFATRNGLCKYDGYRLTVFRSDLNNIHHLKDNNIYCIADDHKGNLWIGTDNGINRFNKAKGIFEDVKIHNSTSKVVSSILITKDSTILIGLDDGLFVYDTISGNFVHHIKLNMGDIPIKAAVKSIYEDNMNEIWIGTWNRGLYRYDLSKNIIFTYPKLNTRNSAHVIYQDSRGTIWVGTWGEGLLKLKNPLNMNKFSWKTYLHNDSIPTSLLDDIVYDICEDKQTGTLWIGTRSGLSILNYDSPGKFINYNTCEKINKLPNNEINSILNDTRGNIWLGTIGGGVILTNTAKSNFNIFQVNLPKIPTTAIRSIELDQEDNMWLSVGSYGVVLYNNQSQQTIPQSEIPEFSNVQQTTIYDIKRYDKHDLLFATYGDGLWKYSKGEPIKVYTSHNSDFIKEDRIRSLYVDHHNNWWVGTQRGLGIRFNDSKGATFNNITVDGEDLSYQTMVDIIEDKEGKIWISTIHKGIISIEGNPHKQNNLIFRNYNKENKKITSNSINVLFSDSSNRLWAGAENGKLYLYNKKLDKFINQSQNFHSQGSMINSIEEDSLGNLWIGTNNGLARLSLDKFSNFSEYRIYTAADGIHDNFFIPHSSYSHKGKLYFGGYKGLTSFQPSHINSNVVQTPFYITDIDIMNHSFTDLEPETAHSISNFTPTFSKHITIQHKNNNFSIYFASLNYINLELNRYTYKLEGFDDDWRFSDAKQNFAYYNNLPAGNYTFLLRATTQYGIWNKETKHLKIEVLPPLWDTWWAFLIYICLLSFIGYIIHKNALNRLRLRNELRYREMEQSKSEEINHAKLQFFTNISHEILTPLTIISATVDEWKRITPCKENLYSTITKNINRLTRLLQQLLEFRKAESGNLHLKVSYGNISEFIANSTNAFYPLIRKKKMHFSYISNPENIQGLFDIDKIDKILYNLISNAVKYVNENGAIQLELSYLSEKKDYIRISVKDNGEGISKDDMKMLFKRFYEGDYRRHNTTGTGIGLSLVKDLVTLSHGTIDVISEEGQGTEFIVVLPIDIIHFDQSEIELYNKNEQSEKSSEEIVIDSGQSITNQNNIPSLLAVEDNEEILHLINQLLSKDYNVYTAVNGKDAMLILEQERIDIIVSDIMMDEIDGIELCKLLKNNIEYCHIPIILLTAKTDEKDRADAYKSGADAFISKPFNLNVLYARINNLLRKRERIAHDFKGNIVFELKDMHLTNLDEIFIKKAIECVNLHLDDSEFDQQKFAQEMNVSKSTLYNKLKTLMGLNTSAFITNIRMKAACHIINQNQKIRISDLAYAVGFNDPKYFSSCFKKEFNMNPSEYIERFSNQ